MLKIQCDSCAHKQVCRLKTALTNNKERLTEQYKLLLSEDKELTDNVIFSADCRLYSSEPSFRPEMQSASENFL